MNARRLSIIPLLFLSTVAGAASPKDAAPTPSPAHEAEKKPAARNLPASRHIQVFNRTSQTMEEGDQQLFEFALLLEHGIRTGDAALIQSYVDAEAFVQRATHGVISTPEYHKEMLEEAYAAASTMMGKRLVATPPKGSSTDYTRLVSATFEEEGAVRLLYRILPGWRLNYLEFEVRRNARGQFVIVDATDFLLGDSMATGLRNLYQLTSTKPAPRKGARAVKVTVIDATDQVAEFQALLKSGQYAQALEAYEELPERLRDQKDFLLKRLSAAGQLGTDTWLRALADVERALPEDPVLELLLLDKHRLEGNVEGEMEVLERLRSRVKDPFLHYMRGLMALELKRTPEARASFEAAIKGDPTLQGPYIRLFSLHVEQKEYAHAVRTLENLEQSSGFRLQAIKAIPELEGFLQSPEYRAFEERRAAVLP